MFKNLILVTLLSTAFCITAVHADTDVQFDIADFGLDPQFNELTNFEFDIQIDLGLLPGTTYSNPPLVGVQYTVFGVLMESTPSGFPAFNLVRTIGGAEFYDQGSSMEFEVKSDADLSDGIQISDLVNGFVLNAREVDTGRYHPPLVELNSDGTGRIQNSNNMGGINPGNGMKVDVDFGEEYIVDLTFDPTTLTIANSPEVGDVNGDCEINLLDVDPFIAALGNGTYDYLADINGDGADNLLDVAGFVQLIGN